MLGDFTVQRRDAWDSGNTWFYSLTGTNLNFQTGDQLGKGFNDDTYVKNVFYVGRAVVARHASETTGPCFPYIRPPL